MSARSVSHWVVSLSLAARAPCDWSLSAPGTRGHRHIISWAHTGLFSKIHFPTSRKDIEKAGRLKYLLSSSNVLFYLYVHKNNRLKRKMTSRKDILSISELVCTKHLKWYCDMLLRSLSALSLTLWHWFWSLVTKLSLRELEPDWGQLLVNQSPQPRPNTGNVLTPANWQTLNIIC